MNENISTDQYDLLSEIGRVESVMNEICIVSGLKSVALSNMVQFSSGESGLVLGFTETDAQVIVLGDFHNIRKGDLVKISDEFLKIKVGYSLLGRVINPLGDPLDEKGKAEEGEERYIESPAKPISERAHITEPLPSGFLIIDSQVPIGLGQRELFVGEKKANKGDVAVAIIANQTKTLSGVISIYVTIDAETSAIKRKIDYLKRTDSLKNSIVVVGRSSDPASLNYIAPMSAVTIAEVFASQGKNVLVIFDNLTKHAKVYRQISLLLNRAPGREAYPGDVFYLHARLLERCGCFSDSAGGGSITAIPLVETQGEEITDYITTNLMSITDGHVLFRQSLSNKGIQPPIDVGFSVSRIGGRAQVPLIRDLSDILKTIIIRFHEVEKYLVFGSELQPETLEVIELGRRTYQFFYQDLDDIISPQCEVALLYMLISKKVLEWETEEMIELREQFLTFLAQPEYHSLLTRIFVKSSYTDAREDLEKIIEIFVNDPATIKRIEKKEKTEAEKETIIDLLKSNQGEKYAVSRDIKK